MAGSTPFRIYDASRPTIHPKGAVVYDSSDAVQATKTDLATVAADLVGSGTPTVYAGINSTTFPGITSTATDLSVFLPGEFVIISGFATTGTGANKVHRVVESNARWLKLEGANSGFGAKAAGDSVTIRKVRLLAVSRIRSITGATSPVTFQAETSSGLSGVTIQASTDDCVTFDNMPNVILPDTANGSAKIISALVGYDTVLMIAGAYSGYTGKIRAA